MSDAKQDQQKSTSVPTRAEIIAQYEASGFALIPLNGKIPAISKWLSTAVGQYGIEALSGRNYGVVLSDGLVVVDVDPRNFKPGDKALTRLRALLNNPLVSYTVRTGGGGVHIYFRKPASLKISQDLPDFPGIEFKSAGRQVVGPGSIHPDSGKEYVVEKGTPAEIADAPEELLKLIARGPEAEKTWSDAGTGEYIDDAATSARFEEYLLGNAPTSGSFIVACRGRDLGLSPQKTWEMMVAFWNPRRVTPRTPEELKIRVVHAYRYAHGPVGGSHPSVDFESVNRPVEDKLPDFKTDAHGHAIRCFHNLLAYLRLPGEGLDGVFGYNEFTAQVEFMNAAPWHHGRLPSYPGLHDDDLVMLKTHLVKRYGFEMRISDIADAVTATAKRNKFHPVREYLEGLAWDGKPRLDFWLRDFLGVTDSSYSRACARKTLCAAVMRIMKPGIKFDHVLVLEGAQRIGKSTVCSILGGKWFLDSPVDPHSKDTVQLMQGKWIVELGEMEVTRRAEADALKAFLSRSTDKVRLAYGRLAAEFPRQSIFIASKNPEADGAYLKDATGNTRWWPVSCKPSGGQVDLRAFREIRNQLWAEAVHVVKSVGEVLHMDTIELQKEAGAVVALRHAEDAWSERIAEWMALDQRDFLTAAAIYRDALGGLDKQLDRRSTLRIAGVMKTMGWESTVKWAEGRAVRGYARVFTEVAGL